MTMTSSAWWHPVPAQSQMRLVQIPERVFHAIARGGFAVSSAFPLSPYLTGSECLGLWQMRSAQLSARPADAPWVTRFVIVPRSDMPVGLAGFHGAPDGAGMVEIGYRIDPLHRRRGYAREALEIMLQVASSRPEVRTVRATIRPDNRASRALVGGYGFGEVGEQWDDEGGREIIFEADLLHV